MSILQYIGARYVPKFYENPNNTNEWKSGVAYEPLTIVTYNDDSYTSKITVPANIGNPASNPTYWIKTGNYNAAITAIEEEISDIEAEISGLRELAFGHKVLFISDSYGNQAEGFIEKMAEHLGLVNHTTYEKNCIGGGGFVVTNTSKKFITLLTNYNGTIPRDEFTDIIVAGGVNDANPDNPATQSDISTAIHQFINYAKVNYPNAKVFVGMIGRINGLNLHANYMFKLNYDVLMAYKICGHFGGRYLNGVEDGLYNYYTMFMDDGVHPNDTGATWLAIAVETSWLTGQYNVFARDGDITADGILTPQSGFSFKTVLSGDTAYISMGGIFTVDPTNLSVFNELAFASKGSELFKGGYFGASESHNESRNCHTCTATFYNNSLPSGQKFIISLPVVFHFHYDGRITFEIIGYDNDFSNVARIAIPFHTFAMPMALHR